LFDVRPRYAGYTDVRIKAAYPELPPMVGFASTATFHASSPPLAGDAYATLETQVARFSELDGPAVVVFQDLDEPAVAATFGEIMCTTYRAFGAVGLVTSGAGRDMAQVRALDFPVFTNGVICAHGYNTIAALHIPVTVGGLMIYPGDLLHGDLNGATSIPHDIAAEMADAGDEFMAAEGVILAALHGHGGSAEHLRAAIAEADARIAALRMRVSRAG
ncbi:MAG: RraA family protein, partial [Anaerolineae bacterium]|nr:RraA family protein [Anaerolineae bacterium]